MGVLPQGEGSNVQQQSGDFSQLLRLAYGENMDGKIPLERLTPFLNEYTALREIPGNTYLVHAGQQQTAVYLLIRGEFYLMRNSKRGSGNIIAMNKAPQFIGATQALTEYGEFYSDIITSRDSVCLEFQREYFIRQAAENAQALMFILRNTTRHTMQGSDRMDRLIFNDSTLNLLMYIYRCWLEDGSPGGTYRIQTKNALIADTIGINVRTLYRALNHLKGEGLLKVVKGCVVVTADQLQEIKKRCS